MNDIIFYMAIFCIVAILYVLVAFSGKPKTVLSFKQALDLTNLPIITFTSNNVKLNFILDTGSTYSVIDSNILNSIVYKTVSGEEIEMQSMLSTNTSKSKSIELVLNLDNKQFDTIMLAFDMSETQQQFKQNTGAIVHGIIGTDFLEKYSYIIDFNKYVINYKK